MRLPVWLLAIGAMLTCATLGGGQVTGGVAGVGVPPPNDICDTAAPLAVPGTVVGDTTDADDDVTPFCGTSSAYKGVWYVVTGTGGLLKASTCNPTTDFDTKIQVFCDCGDLVCVGGNDDAIGAPPECDLGGFNRKSIVEWCSAPGQLYYIKVGGFEGGAQPEFGIFELNVTDEGACADPVSCEPPMGRCCYDLCPWDCGEPRDGQVSTVDLLALLGQWGMGGSCDFDGDGAVSTVDLLALLAKWGPCAATGIGCAVTSQSECVVLGGDWVEGLDCSTPCPEPITNETCDECTVITDADLPFSSSFDNSTAAPSPPPGSCNSGSATEMQNDVWFCYTPASDCFVQLSVDPDIGVGYDGITAIYEGPDCSNLVEIACLDFPEPMTALFAAIAGQTYWFQVGDWGTAAGGGDTLFELDCVVMLPTGACCLNDGLGTCVETDVLDCAAQGGDYQGDGTTCTPNPCPQPLPNDTCDTCTVVTDADLPFSSMFNNSLALAGLPVGSCNSGAATVMENDVWFCYTPANDCFVQLSVDPEIGPAFYDGITAIYEGPDCNNLVEIDCLDEPEPMTTIFLAIAGQTYWFQVGDWGTGAGGGDTLFELDCVTMLPTGACCLDDPLGDCVETDVLDCAAQGGDYQGDGSTCTPNPCPQPIVNEDCGTCEVIVAVPFATTIDTSTALPGPVVPSCNSGSATDTDNDVWYCYTPDIDCTLDITVDPATYDGLTAVYTGDCDGLVEIACIDEPEPHTISIAATAGTTYFIQIGDWGSSPGGGTTDISIDCQ